MMKLDEKGRIHYPTYEDGSPNHSKRPRLKRYLREQKGAVIGNVWTDIKPLSYASKEKTVYPTQKPLGNL